MLQLIDAETKADTGKKVRADHYKKPAVAFLIFLFAFVIRIYYLETLIVEGHVKADAKKYMGYAINLLEHGIYSQSWSPDPIPDTQVSPGYPLFLAAIMITSPDFDIFYKNDDKGNPTPYMSEEHLRNYQKTIQTILWIQALIGALTVLLCFFAGLFFLPLTVAASAALLTAISPHLITLSGYLLTETLFSSLLMASLLPLCQGFRTQKSAWLFFASITMGIACLVRPAILLFPVFILPLVFTFRTTRKKIVAGICLFSGCALIWGGWMAFSKPINTTDDKPGLALISFALGMYPDLTYKDPRYKGMPYEDPANNDFDRLTTDAGFALKTLWENALKEPATYLKWYCWGKPNMFWSWKILVGGKEIYVYRILTSMYETNSVAKGSLTLMRTLHPILLILAVFGAIYSISMYKRAEPENKKRIVIALIFFMLLFYFTAVHSVLAPLPRYSIPLRPVLYLAALVLPSYLANKYISRRPR